MSTCLILQVLGNSDVICDNKQGAEVLQGHTVEDVQEQAEWNDEDFANGKSNVDFPLITKIIKHYQQDYQTYLGVILTNQSEWIKHQDIADAQWKEIISSDGHWWENILTEWCRRNKINFYALPLSIDETIPKGVADWEGIASLLENYLNQTIVRDKNSFKLKNQEITIDKIIIQYSSGTPALSSALYLWGIEKKLANMPIEFAYLSRSNSRVDSHEGKHWQWRLKVPQIEQLLDIQDLAGVLTLLEDHPNKSLKKIVRKLDWAVSFNLKQLQLGLNPKQSIIERIAIALWSEEAFRKRGQWMHWYLRVAGAFELAILSLVEYQGQGNYEWQREGDKVLLKELTSNEELQYKAGVLTKLLSGGQYQTSFLRQGQNISVSYACPPVNDSQWNQFKQFYIGNGWKLKEGVYQSFADLRNNLYHALQGDMIDEILDLKTQNLNSVTHPSHPSQVAIEKLNYLLELANLSQDVKNAISKYEIWIQQVKEGLINE